MVPSPRLGYQRRGRIPGYTDRNAIVGWQAETWQIGISLDAHGGEKERRHEKLAMELAKELDALCESEKYREIVSYVQARD
jgi:hypothetical protein